MKGMGGLSPEERPIIGQLANEVRDFIGNALDEKKTALESAAEQEKILRLELTVQCRNEVALHLYQKMGFQIEGVKKNSMVVNGEFVDEYYMART